MFNGSWLKAQGSSVSILAQEPFVSSWAFVPGCPWQRNLFFLLAHLSGSPVLLLRAALDSNLRWTCSTAFEVVDSACALSVLASSSFTFVDDLAS